MNLIIDAGNTSVKLAIYNDLELLKLKVVKKSELFESIKELCSVFKIKRAIISSVVLLDEIIKKSLSSLLDVHYLGTHSKVPFINKYGTPATLGIDRIALASSAINSFPNKNTLVIDAGTCITYDFIDKEGNYYGGAISPGIRMRYKALNNQTDKLPLLEICDPKSLIGDSTENSIHSGVINGVCAEIDGIIDQYSTKYEDLTVILTGGDTLFLSKRLKNTIFAQSNFLLKGLNYLLDYNKR